MFLSPQVMIHSCARPALELAHVQMFGSTLRFNACNRQLGLRREDVFVNLVEVRKENWSFGNGEARYASQ
jgi:hypothetical protein